VNRALGAYIDRLKHIPHDLETDVKNAEHIIRGEAKEVEHKTTQILQPQSTEEEEDGWASDRSDGQQATASTSTPTRRRNRSKSPTPKSRLPPKAIGAPPRKGRRRSSMRKGMLGRVHILKHKHPDNPSVFEDSDGRGMITAGAAKVPSQMSRTTLIVMVLPEILASIRSGAFTHYEINLQRGLYDLRTRWRTKI